MTISPNNFSALLQSYQEELARIQQDEEQLKELESSLSHVSQSQAGDSPQTLISHMEGALSMYSNQMAPVIKKTEEDTKAALKTALLLSIAMNPTDLTRQAENTQLNKSSPSTQ